MNTYRAEFADNDFEVSSFSSDNEAIDYFLGLEDIYGSLWNVVLLDDNYDEVKTVW